MPIYYNPASPTPSTKNTINSVAVTYGIRDFLLNKNLLPSSLLPAGYSTNTAINGSPKVGEPVLDTLVNSGSNVIPNHLPLETEGILWKNLNILPNIFKNTAQNADDLKSIDYVQDITYISPDGLTSFGTAEWPQGVQSYPEGINDYGLLAKTKNAKFKLGNVKKNLYLDDSKQLDVADFIVAIPGDITQQVKGYLETYGDVTTGDVDKYGSLNLGQGGAVNTANAIGSVLNGQGLGLAKAGIVTNFDIRSSLAGRVLGATGLLNDTKLGTIGGQQLALALANNAAFNVQQELIGKLNIKENVLSLIKGDGLAGFRPNYKITIPKGGVGRTLDFAGKILGFTLPRSYMNDNGSIFQSETGEVQNIARANELLMTTGKGQLVALIKNAKASQNGTSPQGYDDPNQTLFRTGYIPGYILDNGGDKKIEKAILYAFEKEGTGEVINLFNKEDGIIPDLSYLREEKVSKDFPDFIDKFVSQYDQFDGINVNRPTFSWMSNEGGTVNNDNNIKPDSPYQPFDGGKKNLLTKTQILFNSRGMKNIVTRKGEMNNVSTQIQTANGYGFSKGNAVLTEKSFDKSTGRFSSAFQQPEDAYCRSWTTYDRYDTVDPSNRSGLVRSSKFYDDGRVPFRFDSNNNSVLEDTGFVKIAPYTNDFLNPEVPRAAKNYMFSIENLAWHDARTQLPKGELGLGDPLTGKQGRIMWFPPYDIQISESVSIDWESHKFVGRGENIYTYNNTERTGQLSFKIIVDHPTYMNTFRGQNGPDDHYVASFIAGCIEPDSLWTDRFTVQQASKIVPNTKTIPRDKVAPPKPALPPNMKVYFANDQATFEGAFSGYENGYSGSTPIKYTGIGGYDGNGAGIGYQPGKFTSTSLWPDENNWGLNYSVDSPYTVAVNIDGVDIRGFKDPNFYPTLTKFMKEKCEFCYVEVVGYASDQGKDTPNQNLAIARAEYIRDLIIKNVAEPLGVKKDDIPKKFKAITEKSKEVATKPKEITYKVKKVGDKDIATVCDGVKVVGCKKKLTVRESATGCWTCPKSVSQELRAQICRPDKIGCKQDRFAEVTIKYDAAAALAATAPPEPCIEETVNEVTTQIREKFYNETLFFDKLQKTDKFIFDKFREKIRYFHPAFHSTTPEGLNSRLTFLHQCTRQGPTLEGQGASNLAFGRAPVCILRIGDFFYTKVIFDSLSIEYEPLVWDLNPEGIGVQPMIANVSLSFKFVGAESLYGPINKLQNALSFNYYANTRVYEARADYLSEEKEKEIDVNVTDTPGKKDVDGTAARYDVDIIAYKDSPTGLYLHNGNTTVNPEVKTFTKELSKKNSCDVDQTKSNDQTISNENNQNAPKPNDAPTGFTADDIQSCINIVSVDYVKDDTNNIVDYDVTVVLKFEPKKDITEFMISDKGGVAGKLYLLSDAGKNKLYIGNFFTYKNDDNTMIVGFGDKYSSEDMVVNKTLPVNNFNLKYFIQDTDDANFITEMLTKPQPMFTIEWTRKGAKSNCAFPYK